MLTDDQLEALATIHLHPQTQAGGEVDLTPLLRAVQAAAAAEERERIAQHFDSRDKGAGGFYDPSEPAEIIRALGPNVEVEAPLTAPGR